MAILKTSRASREEDGGDSSPESRGSVSVDNSSGDVSDSSSSEEEEEKEEEGESESSMGSDSLELPELGDACSELCQVGNCTASLPLELYDLPDLIPVLSLETWNECLSEEERFALSEFLPDMDQETFAQTLKELFSGKNFHFGSPLSDLLTKLKGGALKPRVALYSRGVKIFNRCKHYHLLREYQDSMVGGFEKIRDAWRDCSGYGIEERLRLLNILRSRRVWQTRWKLIRRVGIRRQSCRAGGSRWTFSL